MTETRLIRVCAPRGSTFAPEAAANAVGDEFPLKVEGKPYGTARCAGAEVAEDGKSILLTLEADRFPEDGMTARFEPDVEAMEADPLNRGQSFS